MKQSRRHLAVSILVGLGLAAVAITIAAPKTKIHAQNHLRISLTTDWSHRHMIFTAPDSITTAWRLQGVSRYQQQWFRRYGLGGRPDVVRPDRGLDELSEENGRELRPDWGQSLPALPAATSSVPGEEVFPAKYSFDINAPPSCTNDFVVYPTGAPGSGTAIAASATGFFSATAARNSTIEITNGVNILTMTAENGNARSNGLGTFGRSTSAANSAANLAAAINISGNGSSVGVSATSAGATVTITATAGSAGNTITAVSSTAGRGTDASNFTWSAANSVTLEGGADGTASIMALNNLYSGTVGGNGSCGTSGPSLFWYYNTGGTVVTSPVLSPDGTQVAFVQNNNVGGGASLIVLKFPPPTASPANPFETLSSDPSYPNCTTLPCMISVPLSGGATDTMSSPFYVYGQEVIYVGDDSGVLHKFSNVFNQGIAPAEVTTSWPITVHSGFELTGPVFDVGSGNIFVADADGTVSYVRETTSSAPMGGTCASGAPPCLGTPHVALGGTAPAIVDPPTVDGTNETVFVFDGSTNGAGGAGSDDEVLQTDTELNVRATLTVPGGTAPVTFMRAGDFDNTYYTANAGSGTGKLYFSARSTTGIPTLYRVGFHSVGGISEMNGTIDTGSLALTTADDVEASPITEVYNSSSSSSRDLIFMSVGNHSRFPTGTASCATVADGCILSFNVPEPDTGGTWPPTTATTDGVPSQVGPRYTRGNYNGVYAASTGPIIIDNVAATTGAGGNPQFSNIYFLWLTNATNTQNTNTSTFGMCNGIVATGGCAVKLTQAALQ